MSHRGLVCSRLALIIVALVLAVGLAQPKGIQDLAGPLRALAAQAAPGGMSAAAAGRLGMITEGDKVGVTILFRSEAAAAATGLSRFGGRITSRRDRRMEALVPVDRLVEVASLPQVAQVAPATQMIPLQGYGATSSEGVQLTNATAFHLAGIYGSGVKIAIIDTGFVGLPAEVPVDPTSDVVDFRLGTQAGALGNTSHGAAVAEIVADMADECEMTLILVDTTQSVEAAIDYVIAQGFKIANMSLGLAEGPFDGSHPLSQAVNRAANAGVLWVNAAGNWAQQHWQGQWSDNNSDTYMEFSGSRDTMNVDLNPGTLDAYLSWYATAGGVTANDYDLVLTDSTGAIVARSAVTQDGDDPPKERLTAYIGVAGQYRLRVQRMSSPTPGAAPEKFQLYTPGVDIETSLQHSEDSLAIPAEAPGAYAVGATRGSTVVVPGVIDLPIDRLEPFSSRGSIGSNAKPNIVGPDGVRTSIAGYSPFPGTSAAAPHVAGAAVLLLSEDQSRPKATLQTLLQQMARKYTVPTDIPEADINGYGLGRVSLRVGASSDGEAPVTSIDFPVNNSTITSASPRVIANVVDRNGVDADTIQVWLDGTKIIADGVVVSGAVTDYVFDSTSGALTFIINNMTRTLHAISVQGSDLAGNASLVATSNFRITTPTITPGLHIIALPYPDLANKSPSDVFGVPLDSLALLRWVPSDSRPSKYHIYPDDYASFAPPDQVVPNPPVGLGYFLSLPTSGTLNVSGAGITAESYSISLIYGTDAPRGWNLIGNPYEGYVDWGSVEFLSSNGRQDLSEAMTGDSPVTDGVIFEFVSNAGGGYYNFAPDPTQATMVPLAGYWLHVLKNCTLIVPNTSNTTSASAPRRTVRTAARAAAPSAGNWLLQLQARAGRYEDPANYVGVAAAATDGYDVGLDVSEPPPLVDALRMYMPAAQGSFAKDMRSAVSSRQSWDVEVACRLADTPITVSWPSLNSSVPRDLSLRLEDKDTGAGVYMRTSTGYTFQMSEPGVRHLRIVADTAAGNALVVSGVSAAAVSSGQMMFTYTVSRAADVTVEVRNISGALIRNLGQHTATAGTTQTLSWNGQSDRGTRVPTGRYLARLTARAADGQSIQVIRPFTVGR